MIVTHLTSKENPVFKKIRLVVSQARKAPADLVLAEGMTNLEEATNAGCIIDSVIYSERFPCDPSERMLLQTWRRRGVKLFSAKSSLIASVSGVQSFQGALALVRVPIATLDGVNIPPDPLVLCICGIQDPGNIGALIRTGLAAGVSLICTTMGTVSARNPKAVRASAGAFFASQIVERIKSQEFMQLCRRHSIKVFRADAHEGLSYAQVDYRAACALLLGNEGHGIPTEEWDGSQPVHIPMERNVESLGVAAAGAVFLFEAHRQRSARS